MGASSGSINGVSYSEISLGLNWFFSNPLSEKISWRNAVFNRFGSQTETVVGLDTSLRYNYDSHPEPGQLGVSFFLGPGYRLAKEPLSGAFAEGAVTFRMAGLNLGVGFKAMQKDTSTFILLGGGGSF